MQIERDILQKNQVCQFMENLSPFCAAEFLGLKNVMVILQGSHRLEKYLNVEGFLEKSLKIKSALKSTGKSLKSLEKSLNSTIYCRA